MVTSGIKFVQCCHVGACIVLMGEDVAYFVFSSIIWVDPGPFALFRYFEEGTEAKKDQSGNNSGFGGIKYKVGQVECGI